MTTTMSARPGDFAVVCTGTWATPVIQAMERLNGNHGPWDHAVICSDVTSDGIPMIVEAEPRGAREVRWHYQDKPHLWSTSLVVTSLEAALAAKKYVGVGYSALDYAALAARHWRIPAPGLKEFIGNSGRMICSQLVDQSCQDADIHLFRDGRWPGYVTPDDLGTLLEGIRLARRVV